MGCKYLRQNRTIPVSPTFAVLGYLTNYYSAAANMPIPQVRVKCGNVTVQLSEARGEAFLILDSKTLCRASGRFTCRMEGAFKMIGSLTVKHPTTKEFVQVFHYRLGYVDGVWVLTDEVKSRTTMI